MSRVHDALRKAAQEKDALAKAAKPSDAGRRASQEQVQRPRFQPPIADPEAPETPDFSKPVAAVGEAEVSASEPASPNPSTTFWPAETASDLENLEPFIQNARQVPYDPVADALIVNPSKPREAPAEEFRSLRTRLNHLQTQQPLHTLVVTSASPAEGKSFTASNLAVTQSQLTGKRVLLADFDFRRPTVDKIFRLPAAPGITDFLMGKARVGEIITKIGDTNLYVMTAGDPVSNPLELLNLKECGALIDSLRNHFDWVILDSPPLLFAADGNLLATMCDGTILVVRIGTTTFDSVTRAMQSLCENNVLGVVVNGARRSELYSKYSYYHDYYYANGTASLEAGDSPAESENVPVDTAAK